MSSNMEKPAETETRVAAVSISQGVVSPALSICSRDGSETVWGLAAKVCLGALNSV